MSPTELDRRIEFFHEYNIAVAIDSKITNYALANNNLNDYLSKMLSFGFNVLQVEVDMKNNFEDNQFISDISSSFNLELQWIYNKKNLGNNIYNDKILERIGELLKISKTKVILEIDQKFDLSIFNISTN